VRHRADGDLGAQKVEEFVEAALLEVRQKAHKRQGTAAA
jgi:hypothetical protein